MGGDYTPVAHGIGGRQDLPVPLETAIVAAVAALIVSFVVLAWTVRRHDASAEPMPAGPVRERPAPGVERLVDSTGWRVGLRVVGMLLFAYTLMVGVFGQDLEINPIFGIFYVWWWVGLVPFSLVFGPAWKAISPVRTINAGLNILRGDDRGLYEYDEARFGYWPAAIGLLAFAWMELVYQHNSYLGPVRLWCAIYVAMMLVGGQLWGSKFYENADPFEVYSSLIARLSVWGRDAAGRLVVRTPLTNLDVTLRPHTGLVAVVSVLFGTIVFDSFRDSIPWLKFTQNNGFITSHSWAPYTVNNIALFAFPLAVAGFFCAGTMLTGVGDELDRRRLPTLLAPAVVPIVAGYVVAHYMSYWWEGGQATLQQFSDPFSNGGNWFGTANLHVNYFFAYHPTLLADLKVISVVIGHVLGVISSHKRAIAVLPRKHMITGQIPLLVTMVGFTIGGLYLLFAA